MYNLSEMSADELLKLAEGGEIADGGATQVVSFQQAQPNVPEVAEFPPPAPQAVEENRGRPRHDDPTNPEHIQAIAKRCKRHYIYLAGVFVPQTRKAVLELARELKERGATVQARIDNEDTLVFW